MSNQHDNTMVLLGTYVSLSIVKYKQDFNPDNPVELDEKPYSSIAIFIRTLQPVIASHKDIF